MPRMFDILRGKVKEEVKEEVKKDVKEYKKENKGEDKKDIREPSYVDFPDIIREAEAEVEVPVSAPLNFPKNIFRLEIKKEKTPDSIVSKRLISVVKQHGVDNQEKAREIYESAVGGIKTLLAKVRAKESLSEYMDKLHELLDDIFNQLVMGDNLLISVCEDRKNEHYLHYHIVNVLILSYVLGLNMGFNKSRLSHLGLASIFCDLGIDSMEELVSQPRALSKDERNIVSTHVARSLDITESVGVLNDIVKETIAMHHERAGGGGYPRGIGSDDINPYAKILGLVDVYEAMTHTRPYRERISTHKAVRSLIGSLRNSFDIDVIKVFINKMSVYPIGSIVRLDTGEMARVISVQSGSPLRPVVMIFRGPSGERISDRNIIDLSKQDFPAIEE